MSAVTLYGRPGCHLCDEAREALERVRAEAPFELLEIDIERDDELFKRYLERIPVVSVDGEELFDYEVDEAALRRRLALSCGHWASATSRHRAGAPRRATAGWSSAPTACRSGWRRGCRATCRS